ncbi:FadR family transcriptional regulator [Arthrobacter sp. E918]|uniref:FadR family transcriptional regulator n=2 Tax=Arthrobacter mobilis TaxID=2724944 RepID=A0A7X6K3J9_9MICC|nr:FadR family transcriptional regulator [Arthrobacter mobilis]
MQEFILASNLQPGDKMPTEPELAEKYDVSRQVIREAARLLDQRGLVEIRAGRGMTVSKLGTEGVTDIYRLLLRFQPENFSELMEIRKILEPGIARLAAQRRTDSDVEEMQTILDDAAANLDDFEKCLALDLAFHHKVSESTKNGLLARLAEPINSALRDMYKEPTAYLAAQPRTLDEHRNILEAISRSDPEAAAAATQWHLSRIVDEGGDLVPRNRSLSATASPA